jgi:hypothetical protein
MAKSESEKISESLSVLIIAYRRSKNVVQILELCKKAAVSEIYINIDSPKDNSSEAWRDHQSMLEAVRDFEKRSGIKTFKRIARANQGCAVSVLLGCDWAFKSAQNLIVIEDDCIPSLAFFHFCSMQLPNLSSSDDIWVICGTQFAPLEITEGSVCISQYALTWGWALTREKWREIRGCFFEPARFSRAREILAFSAEQSFWNAGARRAYEGYTDVWDTILVRQMRAKGKFAILPPINLVSNLGNDSVSTHVERDSKWTGLPAQNPTMFLTSIPATNRNLERWLRLHFYRIGPRHLITPKLTLARDILFPKRRKRFGLTLKDRLAGEFTA